MITLLNGSNDSKVYRGRKYGGVRITAYLVHGTTNTTLDNDDFVPANISIQANMNRGMENHQIMSGNGDALLSAGSFVNSQWQFFQPGFSTNTGYKVLVAAGVGINEIGLVSVDIPFGGVLDLTKGGEIVLKGQSAAGVFSAECNLNTSQITMDLIEVEGIESGLPQIINQVVSPNEVSPSFSAGDGVRACFFINRDKTGILTADQVISNINVDTDSKSASWNYNQLIAERSKDFNSTEDDKRCQSFCLLPFATGKVYFGVQIRPTLVSANVNASKNYFVAWKLCSSAQSMNIGVQAKAEYSKTLGQYLTA
jgi:hypothetical protein